MADYPRNPDDVARNMDEVPDEPDFDLEDQWAQPAVPGPNIHDPEDARLELIKQLRIHQDKPILQIKHILRYVRIEAGAGKLNKIIKMRGLKDLIAYLTSKVQFFIDSSNNAEYEYLENLKGVSRTDVYNVVKGVLENEQDSGWLDNL